MRIVPGTVGGSALVQDYVRGRRRAARFYAGSPFRIESYRMRADSLDRSLGQGARERAASLVRPVGPEAERTLAAVVRRGGWFVTTGQQPGLFGGPLYSLYKALSAIRLARSLSESLGKPVMPLFWVASEDHDWAEANQAHLIDQANRPHRLSIANPLEASALPLSRIPLGEGVTEAIRRVEQCFPPGDFHEHCSALVRSTHRPSSTMADAFADMKAALLNGTTIGLVDAASPALKAASRPVLRVEAEDAEASARAVRETSDALVREGYALQVSPASGATHLFLDSEAGRDRVLVDGGGFRLRRSRRLLSRDELTARIDVEPERVSPNVLLRPVVESALFPTLAYVGGPGEMAYFAQLGGLFRRHGLGMPLVAPRASLVVAEARVTRVLDKHGLAVEDLRQGEAVLTGLALDRMPDDLALAVGRWRETVAACAAEVAATATEVDPVLKGAVTKARNSGLAGVNALEKKIVRAVKRRHQTAWSQISKAGLHLWPGGKPQDRVLGPLQYLFRYGEAFVAEALQAISPELKSGAP